MSDRELEALVPPDGFSNLLTSSHEDPFPEDPSSPERRPPRKKQKTEAEDEAPTRPQVKAQREKARREKMNQRFAALAELSNPEEPKTDKASILLDALVSLRTLKMENDQLKQLNKFLEVTLESFGLTLNGLRLGKMMQEKVSAYEKERSFAIYRQGSILNSGNPDGFMCPPGMMQQGVQVPMQQRVQVPEGTVVGTPVMDATPADLEFAAGLEDFLRPPAA